MEIHPYSPDKVLCYYQRWQRVYKWYLGEGELPYPITVSVDPSARCNMRCKGCNAYEVLSSNKTEFDKEYMAKLADTLFEHEVRSVCLGGGGSADMNPHLSHFVDSLHGRRIGIGMVCNGTLLDRVRSIKKFSWIGVSVDASNADTWAEVHQVSPRWFDKVLENMRVAARNGVQITYKYLIRPENVGEIYDAAKVAKSLGVFGFHARPMSEPWFNDTSTRLFTEQQAKWCRGQIQDAKKDFEDENFQVHGVFSKVGGDFRVVHPFNKCWAIFATCVFQSNKKVGLCCDLRGCPLVEVGPFEDPREFFADFWGSDEHRKIQDKIDVSKCPRCTFGALNRLFEEAIIQDQFMIDFI